MSQNTKFISANIFHSGFQFTRDAQFPHIPNEQEHINILAAIRKMSTLSKKKQKKQEKGKWSGGFV